MTERGQIEVLVPVNDWPSSMADSNEVAEAASRAAIDLLRSSGAPRNAKIVGVVEAKKVEHPLTGAKAITVRLLCEAPDALWEKHTARRG